MEHELGWNVVNCYDDGRAGRAMLPAVLFHCDWAAAMRR